MAKLRSSLDKSKRKQPSLSVKKLMNFEAPDGYEYRAIGDESDLFHLFPKDKNQSFTFNAKTKLPKEIDGFEVNPENLYEVMFITQKPLIVTNNEVTVGNKTGKFSDLVLKSPYTEIKESELCIAPLKRIKIEKPLSIIIGGTEIDLLIERVPYPSLKIHKFKSHSHEYLFLDIFLDTEKGTTTFNFTSDFSKFKYIEDFILDKNIVKGFWQKDIQIAGTEGLEFSEDKEEESKTLEIINYRINFFEKMLELQKILKVKFEYTNLEPSEMINAKKLYCSLVKNSYYSFGEISKSPHKLKYEELNEEIREALNRKNLTAFAFSHQEKISLMGCEVAYLEVKYATNVFFENLNEKERTVDCRLEENGKEMYRIHFNDDEYRNINPFKEFLTPSIINLKDFDWDFSKELSY